jgi:ribosomal protein S18 acetylase RimI-like enzyme
MAKDLGHSRSTDGVDRCGQSPVRIRMAVATDLPVLAALWMEFLDFNARFDARFTRAPEGHEAWVADTASALEDPSSLVLVAESGGEVVGFLTAALREHPPMVLNRAHGFVRELGVTGRARRLGVGSALYREAESWLRERGVPVVELHVAARNPVSMAFWRAMGFEPYVERMAKDMSPAREGGRP